MASSLTQIIDTVLANITPDAPRNYIGASSIGNDCPRAIWYGAKSGAVNSIDSKLRRTFDLGKHIESMVLEYLDYALELKVTRPTAENNYLMCQDKEHLYFSGHMDALITFGDAEPIVLDVKSCKNSSFNQFVKDGLKQWSMTYYAQLQSYMGMTGYNRAILLAFNKDTSQLHDELITFDEIYYEGLRARAQMIYNASEPPERINRNPVFFKCAMCNYKVDCHTASDES